MNVIAQIYSKFQSETQGLLFNRGVLFNIGFKYAMKDRKWDCLMLHDVDLLPENINNTYKCWDQVKALSILGSTDT